MYLYLFLVFSIFSSSTYILADVLRGEQNDSFSEHFATFLKLTEDVRDDCINCVNSTHFFCIDDKLCKNLSESCNIGINQTNACQEIPTPTPITNSTSTSSSTTPTTTISSTSSSTSTQPSTVYSTTTHVPSKTTVAPTGRHFDPPSFIGGIVLALGLLAIIYVSFKFYKARTERNYHTL